MTISDIFLPPDLSTDNIAACIGLVSDTHAPDRWPEIPTAVFDILNGVDLILHAGDVGELWVLDRLSAIAPVVAVHGNDETAEATRELPYQQLLTVGGQRLLLCHSHFPDREQELASRKGDDWASRLERYSNQAQRAGAQMYVLGHWHIPFFHQYNGVWLINPGAIASGNPWMRQSIQTVAFLFIRDDGRPFVTHVDLAHPERPYAADVDWAAGIQAAFVRYHASILSPELQAMMPLMTDIARGASVALRQTYMRLAHRCWAGEMEMITAADLLAAVEGNREIAAAERDLLLSAFRL